MRKLIIEIPADRIVEGKDGKIAQLEEGDFEAVLKLAESCSLYVEFGKPHSNPELADLGIAECFAIDVSEFTCKIEDDDEPITMEKIIEEKEKIK